MFPYHDDNKTLRPALMTLLFIALNVLVWFLVEGAGSPLAVARSVCDLGLIPGALTGVLRPGARFPLGEGLVCIIDPGSQISHVFTSMFLHGSWAHLLGNMWFLWLFGNNIEDAMTRPRFIVFYLLCGLAAAGLQVFASPDSAVPMVGASGAISGVMGAYLVLFPRVRVYTVIPLGFFLQTFALPAWAMLLYWAALQVFGGLGDGASGGGGVAFWAHIGGFLSGVVLVKFFTRADHLATHRAGAWRPASRGWQ